MTRPRFRLSALPVLIDTGGYYAFASPDDPNHERALAVTRILARGHFQLFTTHLIIAETHTLLRSRLRHRGRDHALSVARQVVAAIQQSAITIEPITAADMRQAVEMLFAYADQELSFTDVTSFAVMRRLGISHVFAFDDDFAVAGFTNILHVV